MEAGHGAGPPTPTNGDDGEDDNARADQYRPAGFGICFKKRMREAKVLAVLQPCSIREQLGGSAVKGSGYPEFNMSTQL